MDVTTGALSFDSLTALSPYALAVAKKADTSWCDIRLALMEREELSVRNGEVSALEQSKLARGQPRRLPARQQVRTLRRAVLTPRRLARGRARARPGLAKGPRPPPSPAADSCCSLSSLLLLAPDGASGGSATLHA